MEIALQCSAQPEKNVFHEALKSVIRDGESLARNRGAIAAGAGRKHEDPAPSGKYFLTVQEPMRRPKHLLLNTSGGIDMHFAVFANSWIVASLVVIVAVV
ncbi:hypothetical protein K1T73_09740 [Roseovarius sp. SCSIO 43702]|uniref:hypothetical protein n=1 Tax=Roseovarius sp. SCSIO 43702 TaxID=2823043 RepID=UPI001C739950|nr:hypothetical protein [Roseovarius sp. SCSIO 43702]QYX55395.1 hypothetical protein K1T73_09740 [Roseovarius sp. SCSIO 43702]